MHKLTFITIASDSSNDHQTRPVIDGADWLGDDHLGLDPPEFFRQPALQSEGELVVGRCTCGVLGCGDRSVIVEFDAEHVYWRSGLNTSLQFLVSEYEAAINSAQQDFSWESVGRTAERLVNNALMGAVTTKGYRFSWSSTRIRPNTLTICLDRDGNQDLIEIPWNSKADEETVLTAVSAVLREKNP